MTRFRLVAETCIVLTLLASLIGCGATNGGATPAAAAESQEVLASAGSVEITRSEVERRGLMTLMDVDQQRDKTMREVIRQLAVEKVLIRVAEERNMTIEELADLEVAQKIATVTDADIQEFWDANQHRVGDRTLDELRDQIGKTLVDQRMQARYAEFLDELMVAHPVEFNMDYPRADVKPQPDAQTRGPHDAPVKIIEFGDYECPYCRRVHPVVERVLAEYGDQIHYTFQDYPLSIHPRAIPAATAARCAAEQDRYWDFHEHLMVIQGDLSFDNLKARAVEVGLDPAAFDQCFDSRRHEDGVREAAEIGRMLGIQSTPTILINGRLLVGVKSFEAFKEILDEELGVEPQGGTIE